ncbi:helix-turn-helix transcriptional regulator [Nonomuraea sp. NPDC003754]
MAELLRRHRHAARLTLEQLAEASGVSARTLSNMERGRRPPSSWTAPSRCTGSPTGGCTGRTGGGFSRSARTLPERIWQSVRGPNS